MSGLIDLDPATTYFPTRETCSIIGSSRLNFRVRDGNGCDPADTITGKLVEALVNGRRTINALNVTAHSCFRIRISNASPNYHSGF